MSGARKRLPPVFGTAELAEFLGWPTHRVRRWCLRNGIGRRSAGRQRLEITYSQLLDRAPDVYYALLSAGAMDARVYVGGDCGDGEGGDD
jgi:hypothetical protein